MMNLRFAMIAPLLAISVSAQSTSVPRLGWLQEAEGVRPVWGVPGGALAGDALPWGDTRLARLNPHLDLVFAVHDGTPSLGRLGPEGVEWQALEGAVAEPRLAVWSPSGQALALAGPDGIQIFTRTAGGFGLRHGLPGAAAALALGDSGDALLVQQESDLLLWRAGNASIVSREAAGDFTFFAQSDEFAYQTPNELVFAGPHGEHQRLAHPAPAALAAGRQLLALRTTDGASAVDVFAAQGTLLRSLPCACQAEGWRAAAPDLFELATGPDGPRWWASGDRVFFVPVRPAPVTEGEGN